MSENEKSLLVKKIEEEFEKIIAEGEDLSPFLYIPYVMLSDKIRQYLDLFLLEEAYASIMNPKFDLQNFIVYDDERLSIKINEIDQKIKLLDRLINYFSEKEEYEKCSLLLQFKNNLI